MTKLVCTIETVIHFLGYFPAPGVVHEIRQAQIQQYPQAQIWFAKRCAQRLGIRYRIVP